MTMLSNDWFKANREAINQRVAWLFEKPQGIIYDRKSDLHRLIILKEESRIRLFFTEPFKTNEKPKFSGCMSEYDLKDPLNLIITYTQALLLPLLWQNDPQRVYSIGFAGGRVPLLLHHCFPTLVIENIDIDYDVKAIAQNYFGIAFDKRQILAIQDGREYLSEREANTYYDFILVDAFKGTGYSPYPLYTKNFYDTCKEHLVEGGVVITNLIGRDPLFLQKINTLKASFKYVYVHFDPTLIETYVLLSTDGIALNESERIKKAEQIQARYKFPFPFIRRAKDLKPLSEQIPHLSKFGTTNEILVDERPPETLLEGISKTDAIFYKTGRNDPCPCGSGNKFKRCHGRC